MRRKGLLILMLLQSYIYAGGSAYTTSLISAAPCVTADQLMGRCVPVDRCRRIYWLLTNWQQPYPAFVLDYLQRSHCGTHDNQHFGCCAAHDVIWPGSHIVQPSTTYFAAAAATASAGWLPVGEHILDSMPCGAYSRYRVANGEIVELSEYPWMALLEYAEQKRRRRFLCAGTLITDRYVLTAAHCVVGQSDIVSVRLGEHNLNTLRDCERTKSKKNSLHCAPPFEDVAVQQVLPHAYYRAKPLSNDLALLRLARAVDLQTHIMPICLPRTPNLFHALPEQLIIAGWGVTERGYASDVLMKAHVPLQNPAVCQHTFQRALLMTPELICAGACVQSSCRGDSGGPIFSTVDYGNNNVRFVQFGIISAGASKCSSSDNYPAIYTRVSSYMHWIVGTLQP